MDLSELDLLELLELTSNYRTMFAALPALSASGGNNVVIEYSRKFKLAKELASLRDELYARITGEPVDAILGRELTRVYYELCAMLRGLNKHVSLVASPAEVNTTRLSGTLETIVDSVTFTENLVQDYTGQ